LEEQAGLSGQYPGSFRHGDGDGQAEDVLGAADGVRLPEADEQLLAALGHLVEEANPFSFGLLTNTLSITDQLDFTHKLIAAAGRIRTRVEKAACVHGLRTTDGTHGDTP
ncbi:MAG: hypothetical protein ACREX3_23140, partial [Gammaproteobacteria bacterium]